MTKEEIENAQKNAKQLSTFIRENEMIEEFVKSMEENEYLDMRTAHQLDFGLGVTGTFKFIGKELAEIIKSKLAERNLELDQMRPQDLTKASI